MWDYRTAAPDRYELLKAFARENRKNQTDAEALLWEHLRNGQLGCKFLRQHIIGDYIVDFVCGENGLIIEVDGAYHSEQAQEKSDEQRTIWLTSNGFHVIRFTNEEVLFDTDRVIEEIEHELQK